MHHNLTQDRAFDECEFRMKTSPVRNRVGPAMNFDVTLLAEFRRAKSPAGAISREPR
jgi:hypothetical protein